MRAEVPRVDLSNSTLKGGWGGESRISVDFAFIESEHGENQTHVSGLQILFLAGKMEGGCVIYGRTL